MPKISRIQIIESSSASLAVPASLEADLAWVQKRGVDIERQAHDERSSAVPVPLPLVLVDGNMAISGRYPTREEMGIWMTFGFVLPDDRNAGGIRCCTL